MKIRPLDIGLEAVTRWQADDEIHLPSEGGLAPAFLPSHRPLDEIMRRPSLDERLSNLMQPAMIDPDLMHPAALSDARRRARSRFAEAADRTTGRKSEILAAAGHILDGDIALDDAVYEALAALLKG